MRICSCENSRSKSLGVTAFVFELRGAKAGSEAFLNVRNHMSAREIATQLHVPCRRDSRVMLLRTAHTRGNDVTGVPNFEAI